MPVAPARHAGSRAHTLVSAHTFGVGVFRVFACGRALLGLTVGVFARGWLGLVFALLPVFAWGVCALACVRSPGGWDSSVSPPLPLLVGAHAPVWALLACARAGGRLVRGAGHGCPAPLIAWWRALSLESAEERIVRVGCSPGVVNTPLSCARLRGNG